MYVANMYNAAMHIWALYGPKTNVSQSSHRNPGRDEFSVVDKNRVSKSASRTTVGHFLNIKMYQIQLLIEMLQSVTISAALISLFVLEVFCSSQDPHLGRGWEGGRRSRRWLYRGPFFLRTLDLVDYRWTCSGQSVNTENICLIHKLGELGQVGQPGTKEEGVFNLTRQNWHGKYSLDILR